MISQYRIKQYVAFPHESGSAVVFGQNSFLLNRKQKHAFDKFSYLAYKNWDLRAADLNCASEFNQFLQFAFENSWLDEKGSNKKASGSISKREVIEALKNAYQLWSLILGENASTNHAVESKGSAITYLIENAWFVSQVEVYLSAAAKKATGKLKRLIVELLRSERSHYKLLIRDLGVSKVELDQHDPTPGTKVMLAHLHFLAATDPMSLCLSINLLETHSEDREPLMRFVDALESVSGISLSGFRKHYELDLDADHGELWKKAVSCKRSFSRSYVSKLLADLHSTKHMLMIWDSSLRFQMGEAKRLEGLLANPRPKHFLKPRAVLSGFLPGGNG